MADLGKIVVTDGGTYSAAVTYEKLTFVHYNDDAYLTLKTVKGVTPTDDGVNYRLFCKSAVTATTSKAGIVMPDGTTIGISNGKITAKTATQTTVGVTKGSNDIIVGKDGGLSLNTKFEQATALANIVAGEALKVVLGKVSKAIATTMNLDENALLKNMISGIDVNNGEKVPSSAFVHTLYERLGMGTDLSAGDAENVTQAVNALYSDLNAVMTSSISIPSESPVTGNRAGAQIHQNKFLILTGEVGIDFTNLKNWNGYDILRCSNGSKYPVNFIATDENGGSFHMQIQTNGIIRLSTRGYIPENKSQILRFFCIAPIGT